MNKIFKKIAVAAVGFAMAIGVGVAVSSNTGVREARAATVTDVLNASDLTATTTTYTAFSNVTKNSSAKYTGQSSRTAKDADNIQLRSSLDSSDNHAGIVTTTTGGTLRSVTLTWVSTATDRYVDIYAKNTAYEGANDLWDNNKKGTNVGNISYTSTGSTTSYTFDTDYSFLGIRSRSSALAFKDLTIVWTVSDSDSVTPVQSNFDIYSDDSVTLADCVTSTGSSTLTFAVTTGTGSISNGIYTPANAGEATITATKGSASCTFTITTTAAPVYTKITSDTNLTGGTTFVLAYDSGNGTTKGASSYNSSHFFNSADITISTNTITTSQLVVFTLEKRDDDWTIKQGSNFMGLRASNNSVYLDKTSITDSDTGYLWSISFSSGKVVLCPKLSGTGNMQFNAASNVLRFSNYTNNGQSDKVYMFAILAPEVTPSPSSATIYTTAPSVTSVPVTLTKKNITPTNASTVTSSNTSVIPVANCVFSNAYGTLTITQNGVGGSSTITVTLSDGTKSCSCTITITVQDNSKTLSSIAITADPQTSYFVGEQLDTTDMEVTATFSDKSTDDTIASSCKIYLGNQTSSEYAGAALTTSDVLITVTYTYAGTTKSATKPITVSNYPTYSLVTNVDDLYVGTIVVIAGYDGANVISTTQNSNNRPFSPSTLNSTTLTPSQRTFQELTIGIHEMVINTESELTYSLYDSAREGYLYAASSTNNYLRTEDNLDDNGKFTLSFETQEVSETNYENCAVLIGQGEHTHSVMRYNTTNSVFSCYEDSTKEKPIKIFKKNGQTLTDANYVDTFVARYMKMVSIDPDDEATEISTPSCENNWDAAFAFYDDLNQSQQELFVGGGYAKAAARFAKWATANGYTLDPTTGALSKNSIRVLPFISSDDNSGTVIATTIISVTSLAAIGGYFFLRKRRHFN